MIGLENYPNIVPASVEYPNGDIKDTPSGTPVNAYTNGDLQQFLRKMADIAGITPNGLRDNETNGYQSIEALQIAAKPYDVYTVVLQQSGTGAPTEQVNHKNELSGLIAWSRSGVGSYAGTLAAAFPNNKVVIFSNMVTLGMNHASISRFDDDNLIMFAYNNAGVTSDNWTMYVEIRVYR